MSKNETKLITFKTNKFFDIEKLVNKNPELYAELCEKYPIKKNECVYAVIYKKEPDVITEEVIADGKVIAVSETVVNEEFRGNENIVVAPIEAGVDSAEGEDATVETDIAEVISDDSTSVVIDEVIEVVNEDEPVIDNDTAEAVKEVVDTLVTGVKEVANALFETLKEFPEDFQPLYKIGEEITISYENGARIEDIVITDIKLEEVNGEPRYYYVYKVKETGNMRLCGEPFLCDHEVIKN